MRHWSDVEGMIFEPTIDRRTEEKMLHGTLDPEDAPPELARVALLLRAVSVGAWQGSTISETDRLRQEQVVASMVAAVTGAGVPAPAKPSTVRLWNLRGGAWGRARLVVTMALSLMMVSAGLAFAGALPSPVQHAASVLLSRVGVHVPDPRATGSPAGDQPGQGSTGPGSSRGNSGSLKSGDSGNGKDKGTHKGQSKNGNSGKHNGQDKNGKHKTKGKVGSGSSPAAHRSGASDAHVTGRSDATGTVAAGPDA